MSLSSTSSRPAPATANMPYGCPFLCHLPSGTAAIGSRAHAAYHMSVDSDEDSTASSPCAAMAPPMPAGPARRRSSDTAAACAGAVSVEARAAVSSVWAVHAATGQRVSVQGLRLWGQRGGGVRSGMATSLCFSFHAMMSLRLVISGSGWKQLMNSSTCAGNS